MALIWDNPSKPTLKLSETLTQYITVTVSNFSQAFLIPNSSNVAPSQHNTAPRYLTTQLHWASNVGHRKSLRSSSSAMLDVSRTEHVTTGGRAFSSTAAHV